MSKLRYECPVCTERGNTVMLRPVGEGWVCMNGCSSIFDQLYWDVVNNKPRYHVGLRNPEWMKAINAAGGEIIQAMQSASEVPRHTKSYILREIPPGRVTRV